jgi:rare lipoprotein A (peptidoglycan hydrolase)
VNGRVIDLSKAAARRLGIVDDGVAKVRIEATPQQLAMASAR